MKIALALSGGGARCLAQLGYLEVLYDLGIEIEAIAGSSAGAIIGAMLARGYTPQECLEIVQNFDYSKIGLNIFKGSIFTLEPLVEDFRSFGLRSFEDLPIPFYATLTHYESAQTKYWHSGDLARAVLASSALIPIFAPVSVEGEPYIDGGFTDNLPLSAIKDYPYRLSINVNPMRRLFFKPSLWGNIKRAGYIMLNANVKHSLHLANRHVQFEETGKFGILDTKHFDEIYAIGVEAGKKEQSFWTQMS